MKVKKTNYIFDENKNIIPGIILVLILPFVSFLPIFYLNAHVIISCIYFIYLILVKKIHIKEIFNITELHLLIFFSVLLICNLMINQTFENSSIRTFGFIRFIIFVSMIIFFIQYRKFKYLELYLKAWLFLIIFISFDLVFEFYFEKNIFGFKSNYPGRLSGMMNDELVIGYFYFLFNLILSLFLYLKLKNKYLGFSIIILFLIVNFLIGERSNFVRSLAVFIFISPFIFNFKINLKKIIILLFGFSMIISLLSTSKNFGARYIDSFLKPLYQNPIKFYKDVPHGAHYNTAIKIFKENYFFGTGIKNYRIECKKDKYSDPSFASNNHRCTTHPHQFHLEILSELGLPVYLFFIFFFYFYIKKQFLFFKKNKNIIFLTSSITIISLLTFPLPTGSFFSSYSSTLFWFIFAFSIALRKLPDRGRKILVDN